MSAETTRGNTPPEDLARGWASLPHDPGAALGVADAVLAETPASSDGKFLRAAALRRQGSVMAAHACLAPLMSPGLTAPIPWFEWGMVQAAMGEEARAVQAFREAVRLAPGFTGAWRAMADALLVMGDGPTAGHAYAQAARAANRDPRLSAAATALCDNRVQSAWEMLGAHVRGHPGEPRALHLLAEAETRIGRPDKAEQTLARCLDAAPEFADARHTLAVLFYVRRKFGAAGCQFQRLLDLAPQSASLRVLLSVCLVETGDFTGAIQHYEALLAGTRVQPKFWLLYAHGLKTLGREQDAIAAYQTCIALAPDWAAGAYLSLADVKTYRFSDGEIQAMHAALARVAANRFEAAQLHYALARAFEQRGEWAAAFAQFASGARIRRASIAYDPASTTSFVEAARAMFDPAFFAARRRAGCPTAAPIFVVGMPRSGSTLVEQIMASHGAIEGTAELDEIGDIVGELCTGQPIASLPATIANLDTAALTRLGERYMDETQQYRRAGKPHFIDKMPDNFLHAGLIHLMLPNACIIDVRRGAMAAGWAAFKQFFQTKQAGQDYTYDLTYIGRYRRDYVALMAHWQAVLSGRIHVLRYERLVEDTQAETRSLLAFCGLALEPACLRFWETARAVQTPSAQQVRRPIFREGLDQWRAYQQWLGPLREALGDAADE